MSKEKVTSRSMILGRILKEIREFKGFSVYRAVEFLGIKKENLLRLEDKGGGTLAEVIRYARKMGVSFSEVVAWSEDVEDFFVGSQIEVLDCCEEFDDFLMDKITFLDDEYSKLLSKEMIEKLKASNPSAKEEQFIRDYIGKKLGKRRPFYRERH